MMINLNLETLKTQEMNPDFYCILYCIYSGKDPKVTLYGVPAETYQAVQASKYVRENPDSTFPFPYSLTGDGLNLFEKTDDFITFVEQYRNLFPKGVKSGNGTPIRGDKQGVAKKMEWFLRTYPEYSKTTILAATKLYVEQMQRRTNYNYMVQADYLISKDGLSKLAAMCDDYDQKISHIVKSGEVRL